MIQKPKIVAVMAMNKNRTIGQNNTIPWRSREDFQHFKTLTEYSVVVMGRKTWDSLPQKPLPNRLNVVISSIPFNPMDFYNDAPDVLYDSLVFALGDLQDHGHQRVFLIGGAQLLQSALDDNLIDEIELTVIDDDTEGDVKMPVFENKFTVVRRELREELNPKLEFIQYVRS